MGLPRVRFVVVAVGTIGLLFLAPMSSARGTTPRATPSFPAPDCPAELGAHGKLTSSLLSDATHTVKRYIAGGDTRGGEVGCNYYDPTTNYNYGWTVQYLFSTTSAGDVAQALQDGFGPLGGFANPDPATCGVSQAVYAYVECSPSSDPATKAAGLDMLTAAESMAAPRLPVPTTTTEADAPLPKLPLCPEAVAAFAPAKLQAAGITDPSTTGIHVDGKDLLESFQQQIASFNAAHFDAHAYVTNNTPGGSVGAIAWLFSNGGIASSALNGLYVTGNEPKLNDAMFAEAKVRRDTHQPPLSPGDVFGMALRLEGGDVTRALLTAHNTVRALVRGDGAGVGVIGPASDFVNSSLAPIRDGEIGGPWYHLFGTAYMEAVARGDMGQRMVAAFADASAYLDGAGGDPYERLASQYARQLPTASTLSDLANTVEQIYRENVRNDKGQLNAPDPEKYCFNVWGAQLGAELYKSLPLLTTSTVQGMFSRFSASVDAVLELPQVLFKVRYVNLMGSPYSVQWSDGSRSTVLDQGDDLGGATLRGDLPIFVVPLLEAGSWGAAWLSSGAASDSVTFEAMTDGAPLHYARTDVTSGSTAYYETTAARAGDRYTVALDATVAAPVMTGPNGLQVKPTFVSGAPRGSSSFALPLKIVVTLTVLAAAMIASWRIRRRNAAS